MGSPAYCDFTNICTDSDGNNINQRSTTNTVLRYNNNPVASQTDSCTSLLAGAQVIEYLCDANHNIASSTQSCPVHQSCVAGQCALTYICADSDGGNDLATKGTTTLDLRATSARVSTNVDSCSGLTSVIEYSCDVPNQELVTTTISCPPFHTCQDGKCAYTFTCADDDASNDPTSLTSSYIARSDYSVNPQRIYGTTWDTCPNTFTSREAACSGPDMITIDKPCPQGYICKNGACQAGDPFFQCEVV
jgi:hypothetical protein